MRNSGNIISIFDAKGADGWGNIIDVSDYDFVTLQFGTAASTTAVTKFAGSLSDSAPTFSTAQSTSNHWDYIDVIDMEDGSSIDGDTGITVTDSTDYRNLQVNCDGLKWLTAYTDWTAGSVTITARGFTRS